MRTNSRSAHARCSLGETLSGQAGPARMHHRQAHACGALIRQNIRISLFMNEQISLLRAAAHPMNTDGVKRLAPTLMCRAEKCEYRLNIGLFFDGTGNNQDWEGPEFTGGTQLQRKKDSNVARLYRAYPNKRLEGYYPYYVPGVGTPFPDI